MTGIYEASKKRGFTDCSTEMFYVDYIKPFVLLHLFLELTINYPCFFKSESKSVLLGVIQRTFNLRKVL